MSRYSSRDRERDYTRSSRPRHRSPDGRNRDRDRNYRDRSRDRSRDRDGRRQQRDYDYKSEAKRLKTDSPSTSRSERENMSDTQKVSSPAPSSVPPQSPQASASPTIAALVPEPQISEEEYRKKVEEQLNSMEEDEEAKLRESRRRREAILKKYQQQQQQQQQQEQEETEQQQQPEKPLEKEAETQLAKSQDVETDTSKTDAAATVAATDVASSANEEIFDLFSDNHSISEFIEPGVSVVHLKQSDKNNLLDIYDDGEGYYCFRPQEILNNRYRVTGTLGRGVFSSVLSAVDLQADNTPVAIKVIRNNETMYKAGKQEVEVLKKLNDSDPERKRHCITLLSHFEHMSHLCLVFEPMYLNLRETIKKFGRNEGISIEALRLYAKQLLIALKLLQDCKIIHADIKPDNILINERKNEVKVCDFGSAINIDGVIETPYLASRFYRAPEIILGNKYDYAVDMWSIGCTLYELYTGKILFPGHNNNEMLRLFMELLGKIPKKMIRSARFTENHYDAQFNFTIHEVDEISKRPVKRTYNPQKTRDLHTLLMQAAEEEIASNPEVRKLVLNLKDLLERILTIDPNKRITPLQALHHAFFK